MQILLRLKCIGTAEAYVYNRLSVDPAATSHYANKGSIVQTIKSVSGGRDTWKRQNNT